MGAVRSCRCKDKHNLLSGQQSAAINFPRDFTAAPAFVALCGAAAVSSSACRRVVLCLPPYRPLPAAVPFSACRRTVLRQPVVCPASISACSFCRPLPAAHPLPVARPHLPSSVTMFFLTAVSAPSLPRTVAGPPASSHPHVPVAGLALSASTCPAARADLLVLPVTMLFLTASTADCRRTVLRLPRRIRMHPLPALLFLPLLCPAARADLLVLPVTMFFLTAVSAPSLPRTVAGPPASSHPHVPVAGLALSASTCPAARADLLVLPVTMLFLTAVPALSRGLSPGCPGSPKFRESGAISGCRVL